MTVFDSSGLHELFRIGTGNRHGITGAHVHEPYIQFETWLIRPRTDAVPLHGNPDYNYYIGTLVQALETGRYRTKGG